MPHPTRSLPRRAAFAPVIVTAVLGALAASGGARADPALTSFGAAGGAPQAPWKVVGLPSQTKPFTRFSVVDVDGKRALKIEADLSYGNLIHPVKDMAAPAQLSWQWRIEKPIEAADLREKRGEDTAVKVCVSFDLPMDNVPFADRQILRIARGRTSDPVPTATVSTSGSPRSATSAPTSRSCSATRARASCRRSSRSWSAPTPTTPRATASRT